MSNSRAARVGLWSSQTWWMAEMARMMCRLLVGRLSSNRAGTVLLATVFALATVAAVLASSMHDAAREPWDRLVEATDASDVVISSSEGLDLERLAAVDGVDDLSGLWVSHITDVRVDQQPNTMTITIQPADAVIDRPAVVDGSPLADGITIEGSFANSLGVKPGDEIDVRGAAGWTTLRVDAIVASATTSGFPASQPGSAYIAVETAASLSLEGPKLVSTGIRLVEGADPDQVIASVFRAHSAPSVSARTAASVRAEFLERAREFQVVLGTFAVLLLSCTLFLLVTLLHARLIADRRQLSLLRVAGLTPKQAVTLIACEHAVVATLGAALGLVAANVAAPRLVDSVTGGLGVNTVDLAGSWWVAESIVVIGAMTAALLCHRALHQPLAGEASNSSAQRPSALASRLLSHGAPVVTVVAAKEVLGRRARTLILLSTIAVASATAVATLSMEASFRREATRAGAALPASDPRLPLFEGSVADDGPLRALVYTLNALLVAAAVVTLVATAFVSRRERIRDAAVLGTIGFTPGQLRRAFLGGQTAVAGIAAVIGIPAGLILFTIAYALANGSSGGEATPSPTSLLLVVPATMTVCALVATVPFLRRHPNIAADASIE